MTHENDINEAAGNITTGRYGDYLELVAADEAAYDAEFNRLCDLVTESDFADGDLDTDEIEALMKSRK